MDQHNISFKSKSSPVKQTPSNLNNSPYNISSFKSNDRDKLISHQLSQINRDLDIKKLIAEIQSQNIDSYAFRQLLAKLKLYCEELLRLDSELSVKQASLRLPLENFNDPLNSVDM